MINREHRLPVTRQVELLGLSRASVYYQPVPVSAADLALMRRIDELHLDLGRQSRHCPLRHVLQHPASPQGP